MMRGHTDGVYAAAFFKDGRRVATCSYDYTVRIWDVEKGELVGAPFEGHRSWVKSLSLSPDEKRIAGGGDNRDNTIIIWDVESNQKLLQLKNHESLRGVWSLCFSPDGTKLATAGGVPENTVIIWDVKTGAMLQTFKGHRSSVYSVAFSPDGLKLASVSKGTGIRVCRADNVAEELLKIKDEDDRVIRSIVWSPGGQQLLSASESKTVKFWNSSNGDQIGQPCIGHTHPITSLAISSGGSFIATASEDGTVRLWNTQTHKQIGQSLEHSAQVHSVAISPNEELVVSGDHDGVVWLWSIENMREQHDAEERILEDERLRLLFGNDMQLPVTVRGRDNNINNDELTGDQHYLFNVSCSPSMRLLIQWNVNLLYADSWYNTTIPNAFIAESLHPDEELPPTQETDDADDNNHNSYANRSIVRARNSEWDNALQDAVKVRHSACYEAVDNMLTRICHIVDCHPTLVIGLHFKGIALCGNKQLYDAMEAFDLAFIFSNRDPITIDFLLLIKAVALFNAGRHDEAMRRIQELAAAYQRSDTLPCSVVNSYLRVQLAIIAFDNGRYSEAADRLNDNIPSITDLFSRGALPDPRLKIFTVLFGWDLDSVWQTVNQRRCEAFLRADRVFEAVESHQYMMRRTIEEVANPSCLEWSTGEYVRVLDDFNIETHSSVD
ncbi:WD40-repeat-containing domain protein [Suillus placidus]|uniref:WD40-repeat-containing domain protein n=1 Tax=Suillus placidus TaxID=48579 RepID=A0A9P7D849_9AGAM|nr:WD40-repeat-containing domain protein [Suillus placidus]